MNTNETASITSGPIFFERNRVFRVYKGGKLFHDFFGDEETDGNFPEEWIASNVKALNKDNMDPHEGVSISLRSVMAAMVCRRHPIFILARTLRILTSRSVHRLQELYNPPTLHMIRINIQQMFKSDAILC